MLYNSVSQPRKEFSHVESKPVSKKLPKTNKKKEGRERVLPVLITVNRSDGKWADSWNTEQVTTLKDLNLEDISTDSSFQGPGKVPKDLVHVELAVQKVSFYTSLEIPIQARECSEQIKLNFRVDGERSCQFGCQ